MSKGIIELNQREIDEVTGGVWSLIVRGAGWVAGKAQKAYKAVTSKQGKAVTGTSAAIAENGPSGSTPQE